MIDIQTDAKAIFLDALDCTSAEEINRFLEKACGTDTGLRRRVEKLVRAHREAGAFLGGDGAIDAACDQSITLSVGTRIGPYLLREQIGEGGMGLVFVADQEQPVRRRVALKVVKPGMDTRQVLARFEAERQALALMDHPNIAKVLDGGTISSPLSPPGRGAGGEGARPYFVMELVRGMPITDYCDKARLTPRQRLELFLPICRAIQHAHQKGVIHRDIKPSNLLVTLYDSHPVPKVIDFGIAKAVGTAFADHSVYTGFAQLVGTPMYMSPEQAEMTAQDVDTRADVYALGVVLYELLTGTTPFDGETLRLAGFDEMRRIIREDEPAKPSHRVTTLSAALQSTVSGQRSVDGRQLGSQLRGGLDWVVMTCLAKDRTRRYESAGALATDIERYLRDEAVEACPPSSGYRLQTFARRNRRVLATVGIIATALAAATAVSTWQAVLARDAQRQAEADYDRAKAAEQRAKTAEQSARTEAAVAAAVNAFLQHDLLGLANIQTQLDEGFTANANLTVRDTLHRAAARIDTRFRGQPLVEAAIRMTIANAYRSVGEFKLAIHHMEQALALRYAYLPADHPDTLDTKHGLAKLFIDAGRYSDALALHVEALAPFKATFGADHIRSIQFLLSYAIANHRDEKFHEAESLLREALGLQPKNGDLLTWLSRNLLRQGRHSEAAAAAQEAFEAFNNETTETWKRLVALSMLGKGLLGQGEYAAAEPLLLKAYEGLKAWESKMVEPWNWRVTEAVQHIIDFYEVTHQPEKVRAWREKLSPMN